MVGRQRNGGIGRGQLTVHLVYHGWDGRGWRPVVAGSLHQHGQSPPRRREHLKTEHLVPVNFGTTC